MKRELQHTLLKKYHVFFDWLREDKSELIQPMSFGIECGNGWYWILDNLMKSIYNYQKNNNKEFIKVTQIKEKLGGLSFYYQGGDVIVRGMVWLSSNMSYNICEYCGTTENVGRTQGWISVCCKNCHDTIENRKNLPWKPNDNQRLLKLEKIKKLLDENSNKTNSYKR